MINDPILSKLPILGPLLQIPKSQEYLDKQLFSTLTAFNLFQISNLNIEGPLPKSTSAMNFILLTILATSPASQRLLQPAYSDLKLES